MNKGLLKGWGQPLSYGAEPIAILNPPPAGTVVISYTRCRNYVLKNMAAFTLVIRDWPPAGRLGILTIEVVPASTEQPTWPATWKWLSDSNVAPTFTANKRKLITAYTRDGGASVLASASPAES